MKFPLVAFKNNIVFNDTGEAYAIYRLRGEPYNHLPRTHREMVVRRLEKFFYGFEGNGQILLLCEELRLDESGYMAAAGVSGNLSRQLADEAARHARSVRNAMVMGARHRRRYLVLQLRLGQDDNWQSALQEFRDATLGAFFRSERWLLSSRRVKEALEAEDQMFRRLRLLIDGRINFNDLDFIIRRNVWRVGVLPPPLPSRDGGKFTPALISSFSDGCLIDEGPGHVVITNGADERHHQVFVTFPDVPKGLPEIGAEWLASLDTEESSVDAVVHFNILRPYKAKKKTATRRRFLKGQIKEALKGDDEPSESEEYGVTEGRSLEGKLESGQPLASMSVCLAVANSELKEARATAVGLMERYSSSGFRAVRPAGDQIKCLYSFIPGAKPAAPMIECDPGFISSSGPTISLEVGDTRGFFLGWSGASPVWWQPGYAGRELNRSNAIFVSGALGGGKSMAIKDMIYFVRLAGGYMFIIDPKNNEYAVLEKLFPVRKIDLNPGGREKFNPFMLAKDPRRAKSIVLDFLSVALNVREDNDSRRVAVSQAVEAVAAMPPEKRNLHSCLDELHRLSKESPHVAVAQEAGQCALLLESLRDGSLGHLVFGTDTDNKISQVTIVNLQGLPLPRAAQNLLAGRITESERQGLAVLYLAAVMAREVAFTLPVEIIKCEVFDEAWMLLGISEGKRVVDELIRMGARSYGVIPILITQNTTDIADLQTIKNNVSYILCFRAQDKDEIMANLELLGADNEEKKNYERGLGTIFPTMRDGWCIMRDAQGRIGQVYIDPRPEYLLDLFDTSPKVKTVQKGD
ncbi:ATP-binding protein [Desulfoscipio geothermicus]|uniref:AAA-like domain-containing protein n=1 Tax=Desulfoscipio geothermicus DSM 3669 TaxID=1121426 RepID=A0A1I6DNX5_9FIRM|nr:ATP-binding protein [Desulfoscipio geothermicus]SFR07067.1 AAA-like domain-containing protein [Desulfoscipio geothermicus DSM 3669]